MSGGGGQDVLSNTKYGHKFSLIISSVPPPPLYESYDEVDGGQNVSQTKTYVFLMVKCSKTVIINLTVPTQDILFLSYFCIMHAVKEGRIMMDKHRDRQPM